MTSTERSRRWRARNGERAKALNRASLKAAYHRHKAAVFAAYGDRCACCGEDEATFLTVDHVDGIPDSHRREGKRIEGVELYRQLIREGFPPTCRLLCFNCNMGRERNGGICPHEQAREAAA